MSKTLGSVALKLGDEVKVDFMHDAIKRCEARDQTVKLAISSATDAKRKFVESVCGVQFVHSLPPVFDKLKRQRIQQQLPPPASINKFIWTGDEDNFEEIERLTLRLKALIGWDDFPSDLELRDVHTQTLFAARLENESNRVEITGKSDIALQHTNIVEPGGFILEDTFLLVEAKKDLSPGALKAAEAKAYMQYVAFVSATLRYVPVLLTDGNIMILYAHNTKLSAHQRLYWDSGQILEASLYLEELVKQIALNNPLMRAYIPGQDDQPEPHEDPGRERGGPHTDHADLGMDGNECERDDKGTPMTNAEQHHGTSRSAGSRSLGQRHCLTEMQDADMQEALRLARYQPCVTAVYGLPPYAKPSSYGLAS
ncbi:hypothetical protein WJX77_006971 [Trebouxia sp. C0004]